MGLLSSTLQCNQEAVKCLPIPTYTCQSRIENLYWRVRSWKVLTWSMANRVRQAKPFHPAMTAIDFPSRTEHTLWCGDMHLINPTSKLWHTIGWFGYAGSEGGTCYIKDSQCLWSISQTSMAMQTLCFWNQSRKQNQIVTKIHKKKTYWKHIHKIGWSPALRHVMH